MWIAWTIIKDLTRDTFRQARASGIFWMMLLVSGICVILCLSVTVSGDVPLHAGDEPPLFLPKASPHEVTPAVVLPLAGTSPLEVTALTAAASKRVWHRADLNPEMAKREGVDTVTGQITLGFGAVAVPIGRERTDAVHYLELVLGGGIAGTFGLLLALVWTAGFLPRFLEPSAVSVLLAKPVPRWSLLLGKYSGVLTFVAFQAVLFVALTWLALGIRTGVWDTTYLWTIPLLVLQFAIFYSFSALIAVMTHSTVASVFGAVLFWLLGWGMNYAWVMVHTTPEPGAIGSSAVVDVAYWVAPKPIDLGLILFNALDAKEHFDKPESFKALERGKAFAPAWSIISSLLFTGFMLFLCIYEFNAADY
jgi:ABC-type transport system involved in multi-copper enzyme maturation permease subunit